MTRLFGAFAAPIAIGFAVVPYLLWGRSGMAAYGMGVVVGIAAIFAVARWGQ